MVGVSHLACLVMVRNFRQKSTSRLLTSSVGARSLGTSESGTDADLTAPEGAPESRMTIRQHLAHLAFHSLWVGCLIAAALYRLDH